MEKITVSDIANIRTIADLRLNASGSKAVFTVVSPDVKKNDYCWNLWMLDTESKKVRQMTHLGKDSSFVWDDDSTLLLHTERKPEDTPEKIAEKSVFYRLNTDGGEAYEAFSVDCNVSDIYPAGKGKYVLKVLVDRNLPDWKTVDKEICEEEKDYHIFDEVPFWGNGRGYISGKRHTLFLFDEAEKKMERITDPYADVASVRIRDGKILYTACTWKDLISVYDEAYLYDIDAKETRTLIGKDCLHITAAEFWQDGYLFTGTDMKPWGTGQLSDFWYMDREGTLTKTLPSQGLSLYDSIIGDCARGNGQCRLVKGDAYWFNACCHYSVELYRYSGGTVEKVLPFEGGDIYGFDIHDDLIVFTASSRGCAQDIYIGNLADGSYEKVTDINGDWLKNKYIGMPEYIPFTDRDGVRVDGWAVRPIDYDETKKYPAVLMVHGGPRCAYGEIFNHEVQVFASAGYFVFYCNPRGSEGYGEEFADLRGKYGTIDYADVMDFIEHAVSLYPVDLNRVYEEGGSYGGFMSNWIVGHTDFFAAVCSQRSISDWVCDFGSSEIGVTFDGNEMAATPWTDMQKMWDQSPIKYACNAKTPILFIHSLEDYNCPIQQGVEMFTAMKYFNVPSRMCIFEGENHSLSRTGKPKHRMRRQNEMLNWFDKYRKGEDGQNA